MTLGRMRIFLYGSAQARSLFYCKSAARYYVIRMKRKILGVVAALFAAACAFSAAKDEKFAITGGPYVHALDGEKAEIVWTTNRPAVSWVETAPDDGTHFYAQARPKFFNSPMGKKLAGTVHRITLRNVSEPVRYRVMSAEVASRNGERVDYGAYAGSDVYRRDPFLLKPSPKGGDGVKFIVVNDIHADSARLANLLSHAPKDAEFLVLNGDMLSRMDSERQIFKGFMDEVVKYTKSEMPVFFARGNHETRGEFSEEFLKYFPTPTGKPYYSFKWGPAAFAFLDAGEDKPDDDIEYYGMSDFDAYRADQAEWFKNLIRSDWFKNSPVKIIVVHVPPSWGAWHGSLHFRKLFMHLINESGAAVILSGHLHSFDPAKNRLPLYPADKDGINVPNVVNSNMALMAVSASPEKVRISFVSPDGGKPREDIEIDIRK